MTGCNMLLQRASRTRPCSFHRRQIRGWRIHREMRNPLMSAIELPKNCAIDGFSQALADAHLLSGEWKSTVLRVPERGFLHCSALTFLCAWGRQQRKLG